LPTTALETSILISYKMKSGSATKTCEEISGGVMMAANIKTAITECLLYFFINSGVTIPNFDKKYTTIGN